MVLLGRDLVRGLALEAPDRPHGICHPSAVMSCPFGWRSTLEDVSPPTARSHQSLVGRQVHPYIPLFFPGKKIMLLRAQFPVGATDRVEESRNRGKRCLMDFLFKYVFSTPRSAGLNV